MHITIMMARAEVVILLISFALCTLSIEHNVWRQCIISQLEYISDITSKEEIEKR